MLAHDQQTMFSQVYFWVVHFLHEVVTATFGRLFN